MKLVLTACLGLLVAGCAIEPAPFIAANGTTGRMCEFERHLIETPEPYVPRNLREAPIIASKSSIPQKSRLPKSKIATAKSGTLTPTSDDTQFELDTVESPQAGKVQTDPTEDSALTNAFRTTNWVKRPESTEDRAPDDAALFLSGGSLHGAFGAGYLDAWKERRKNLPNFAVVTGVSTGAILSTFAFVDRPDLPARLYAISAESRLLKAIVPFKNGKPTKLGYVKMLIKGAAADLTALRDRLDEALNDDPDGTVPPGQRTYPILRMVAAGASNGRVLRVGVVDVDTGQAVALDLGKMALKWQEARDSKDPGEAGTAAFYKDCYIAAVVASSSAPIAAKPVFIDNRMYEDGGARFGAFADEINPLVNKGSNGTQIYMIFNGFQTTASKCGRLDPLNCPGKGGSEPPDPFGPLPVPGPSASSEQVARWKADMATWTAATAKWRSAHSPWQFLDLAMRSEDVLTNQVYRFSAASIKSLEEKNNLPTAWYVKIGADALRFVPPDSVSPTDDNGCGAVKEAEKERLHPIQFYPAYMKCVIEYGRWVAREDTNDGLPSRATGSCSKIPAANWRDRRKQWPAIAACKRIQSSSSRG
ncbi:patatin-like phospholipase family protein [Sphingomonas bacterium]|uniref:patatin-like phospholipase family protein n=1 Tax=Sphingomonas bacterium TaxID=1895847 RepID=UPI0026306453|nr:patatin-like phospholipase family protein [Sphingomonas bacterium]MDB5679148.1 hypothetical protein [Sphingomonas bacterium]